MTVNHGYLLQRHGTFGAAVNMCSGGTGTDRSPLPTTTTGDRHVWYVLVLQQLQRSDDELEHGQSRHDGVRTTGGVCGGGRVRCGHCPAITIHGSPHNASLPLSSGYNPLHTTHTHICSPAAWWRSLFRQATAFNQPLIFTDASKVTTMKYVPRGVCGVVDGCGAGTVLQ